MDAMELATEQERWARERLLEALEAYRRGLADAPVVQKYAVESVRAEVPEGPLTFVASDESEDRLGDVIKADGWDLDAYQNNPVFLWAHDYTRTPVGRSVWTGVEGKQLLTSVVFAPTEFAQEVETLYRHRFLRAVSVGFRAKAFTYRKGSNGGLDGVEFTQQELLEVSAVPVPANPHALAKALREEIDAPRLRSLFGLAQPADEPSPEVLGPEEARELVMALRQLRADLR